jgi:hypothetical protein
MLMNEAIMATRMEGTVSNMGACMGAKKIEHLMALEVIRRRLLIAIYVGRWEAGIVDMDC